MSSERGGGTAAAARRSGRDRRRETGANARPCARRPASWRL